MKSIVGGWIPRTKYAPLPPGDKINGVPLCFFWRYASLVRYDITLRMRTYTLLLSTLLILNAPLIPSGLFQLTSGGDAALPRNTQGFLHYVQLSDLKDILEGSCALLGMPPSDSSVQLLLVQLTQIFQNDANVFVGQMVLTDTQIVWKPNYLINHENPPKFAFYAHEVKDRTCLLTPPKTVFQAEPYVGRVVIETLVQFVNEKCGAFRTVDGALTTAGLFHQHIMNNLYKPKQLVGNCNRIKVPHRHDFFQEYLLRSRPVIIENAIENWLAIKKWTMKYFYKRFGSQEIHIKLTPNGNFEGVESGELWGDYEEDWIPERVRSQLSFPDLVVVRPATAEMRFSDFLDLISSANRTYSAYLEYSSIPYYMPELEEDIVEMPFVKGLLKRRHLNMWLSDGNTLGKLHFDPYDNFLCQVSLFSHSCFNLGELNISAFQVRDPYTIL